MHPSLRNALRSLALLVLAAAANPVQAHGGAPHDKPAAVVKEQQPWGIAGDPARVTRTLHVRMTDAMRFLPASLAVKRGETVRIVVKNDGRMLHEMVIGTSLVLEEHAALMRKFPDMEHDEPYMAHVPPGASAEIVWDFNRAGDFEFACLIPGHYEAGMRGRIRVR